MDHFSNPTTSRRNFLSIATASAAIPLLPRNSLMAATATPSAIALKLGLVTYQWGKDFSLVELLEVCEQAKYAGVELRSTHKHGVEPSLNATQRSEAKKRFADSPVALVGLGSACEYHASNPAVVQKNIDETKAFIDLSAELGGTGVKVRPNGLPQDVPVEKTLEQIGKSLRIVGEYAAKANQQIRLEVHGKGTQEIPNMKKIMQVADHPNVVVCWNCNPTDLSGAGFEANFDELAKWMGTVHIHDLRPGKVDYPWPALFKKLKACDAKGFTGWCLMEDGATPADIPAAMIENHSLFQSMIS
ncbi:MAG: sugar phosphate isomerase/epimerase [Planctomycetaceae bacterium]|jgi:sugar phosphate isomerase/epimerase|nr:sugar phosphate isomerase/epimerase [Planctomycetaceae bacterium]